MTVFKKFQLILKYALKNLKTAYEYNIATMGTNDADRLNIV